MRHLAPGGSGSDDFQNCYCCFFVFFEGGGRDHLAFAGNRKLLRGSQRKMRVRVFDS